MSEAKWLKRRLRLASRQQNFLYSTHSRQNQVRPTVATKHINHMRAWKVMISWLFHIFLLRCLFVGWCWLKWTRCCGEWACKPWSGIIVIKKCFMFNAFGHTALLNSGSSSRRQSKTTEIQSSCHFFFGSELFVSTTTCVVELILTFWFYSLSLACRW